MVAPCAIRVLENKNGWRIVDWLPLDSSVFTSAAYLPAQRTLYLRFRSGELYCYFDFPSQKYQDFLAADSKGRYFSTNIRDRFPYRHLLTAGDNTST
ncbi:MAG TPA: KTSC domain-containing protein [Bryobacteraceae bacterium]|nr:KTSC domain-containing protein [Bryobacteraceae bacterium]